MRQWMSLALLLVACGSEESAFEGVESGGEPSALVATGGSTALLSTVSKAPPFNTGGAYVRSIAPVTGGAAPQQTTEVTGGSSATGGASQSGGTKATEVTVTTATGGSVGVGGTSATGGTSAAAGGSMMIDGTAISCEDLASGKLVAHVGCQLDPTPGVPLPCSDNPCGIPEVCFVTGSKLYGVGYCIPKQKCAAYGGTMYADFGVCEKE